MPTEVIATSRADQQIAELDNTHAKAFDDFLDDLAAQGCQALGYRLSGPTPVDHMCVKHLRGSLRVVVAFEETGRAWILLVGRHEAQDPALDVYAELYRLLGVEPPDSARRDKPPCCDESTELPPVLGDAVTEFVERAARVRRHGASRHCDGDARAEGDTRASRRPYDQLPASAESALPRFEGRSRTAIDPPSLTACR